MKSFSMQASLSLTNKSARVHRDYTCLKQELQQVLKGNVDTTSENGNEKDTALKHYYNCHTATGVDVGRTYPQSQEQTPDICIFSSFKKMCSMTANCERHEKFP